MNLEDIMLNEINQMQKDNIAWLHWFHLSVESKIVKIIDAENRKIVVRGWGKREMGRSWFTKYKISVKQDEILETKTRNLLRGWILSVFTISPKNKGLPRWLSGKQFACQAGDVDWIFELERSPREGNDNTLQYSCLENPMERVWWSTVHGEAKSRIVG